MRNPADYATLLSAHGKPSGVPDGVLAAVEVDNDSAGGYEKLVVTRRRWHVRQRHMLGMPIVPGTLMALYVVGHMLLVWGR